jgi:hypothetical protein
MCDQTESLGIAIVTGYIVIGPDSGGKNVTLVGLYLAGEQQRTQRRTCSNATTFIIA